MDVNLLAPVPSAAKHFRPRHSFTEHDLREHFAAVIEAVNKAPGPRLVKVQGKGYGLFADRPYLEGDEVTTYGGRLVSPDATGDYVIALNKRDSIDGADFFTADEKGRWINDPQTSLDQTPDELETLGNVGVMEDEEVGDLVFYATRYIEAGEELLWYYGDEYERGWLLPTSCPAPEEEEEETASSELVLRAVGDRFLSWTMDGHEDSEALTVDLFDLHHYAQAVKETPRVGDAIRKFQLACGGAYCEGCGADKVTAGRCKGCHVAWYCSIECQHRDWKEGGHAEECQAIVRNEPLKQQGPDSDSLVALRHLVRCSALASAIREVPDTSPERVPSPVELTEAQLHIASFVQGLELEPVGRNWMAGAVKHPGAFRRAAGRADKGRYRGRTTTFAHHVLGNRDHKHGSKHMQQMARLALTFSKYRRHRGK